jgi:hypothetical protein
MNLLNLILKSGKLDREKSTQSFNAEFLFSTPLVVNIVFFMSTRFRTKNIEKTVSAAAGSDEKDSDHGNQSLDTKPCSLDHVDPDNLSDSISVPREMVRNIAKKARQLHENKIQILCT